MSDRNKLKQRVTTAKGRTVSSQRWLKRQLNDPYVHRAKAEGYRARSVYKLKEMDERFGLLKRGAAVVDLGAAPGSWAQYATQRGCRVVAIDLLEMAPVTGATILKGDFQDPVLQDRLAEALGGKADLVLSDMAANATGQRIVDRLRAEGLAELVLDFAGRVLAPGGDCVIKLVKGAEATVTRQAQASFATVRVVRPEATRSDSSEIFLIARGFHPADGHLSP